MFLVQLHFPGICYGKKGQLSAAAGKKLEEGMEKQWEKQLSVTVLLKEANSRLSLSMQQKAKQ